MPSRLRRFRASNGSDVYNKVTLVAKDCCVLTSLLLMFAAAAEPPDTVVVCPKEFVAALSPWLQHREAQGHSIEIVPNTKTPVELRDSIRKIAQGGKLRFVLLVGDADPRAQQDP